MTTDLINNVSVSLCGLWIRRRQNKRINNSNLNLTEGHFNRTWLYILQLLCAKSIQLNCVIWIKYAHWSITESWRECNFTEISTIPSVHNNVDKLSIKTHEYSYSLWRIRHTIHSLPSDNSRSNSANLSLTSSGSFDMSMLNSAMVNPFKNTHKLNRLKLHTHTHHINIVGRSPSWIYVEWLQILSSDVTTMQ